ncbi:MAG: MBL fold metallo-hydrolase [Nitrospirae bacterium]|nr:MBL fold metallo-hydrolase [Nitrospirota bacterium]
MGSGSHGNSVYVESPHTRILIDAGFNASQTAQRLSALGVSLEQLDAVLLTHEHADHAQGIKSITHRVSVPCYTNEKTRTACKPLEKVASLAEFHTNEPFQIKDFLIYPFSVPHDASDTVCFTIQYEEWKVGIATDFGMINPFVVNALQKTDILVLEFNHDLELLEKGPYHLSLKERIRGDYGHLCNEDSASLLRQLLHPSLRHVYLAHLSKANNTHEVAYLTASKVIQESAMETTALHLTWQDFISPVASLQ